MDTGLTYKQDLLIKTLVERNFEEEEIVVILLISRTDARICGILEYLEQNKNASMSDLLPVCVSLMDKFPDVSESGEGEWNFTGI